MKYILITISVVAITLIFALSGLVSGECEVQYLRIHIRANSNEAGDQSVKYKVKEKIVEYMSPKLDNVTSKKEAMKILNANLDGMKKVADKTLVENGYTYTANVKLRSEEFPVRTYGDLTLDSGVYDALIIELGSGTGDNWWCVVFPPLCFVGEESEDEDFEYKSFFKDVYDKFAQR